MRADDPPPHPNPLPVGARAISSLPCNVDRDVQATSAAVETPPLHAFERFREAEPSGEPRHHPARTEPRPHEITQGHLGPDPLAVVERAIGELQCAAGWKGERSSQNATAELFLPDDDRAKSGSENSAGGSMGIVFSSISVNVERPDTLERHDSVQILARLASNATLFRSADGRFCAQVPVGTRHEIYGLKSAAFRDWLIDGYLTDQPEPPSNWAIRRVIGMLEARARFSTGIPEVFVRVGQAGDGADLGLFSRPGRSHRPGPSRFAITVGASSIGRTFTFAGPRDCYRCRLPARDGSIDLLRAYVNLSESDFRLMIAWLTAALRPVGPYPVLVLNGEQASGKSTLAKILRMLIDPQACPFAGPAQQHARPDGDGRQRLAARV